MFWKKKNFKQISLEICIGGVTIRYIIMCGGTYKAFDTPKQLTNIGKERLIDRTIRLLKENGVKDIYISSNNPLFDNCGVPRLENKENNFIVDNGESTGYWLDAFYPVKEKVCYLFGDVCFTKDAIKTIVNYKTRKNVLFGNKVALNEYHVNWGEPFAYIVSDYKKFFEGIKSVKELYNQGKVKRHPIVWELYRYLNNLDINKQYITKNYVVIDDGTIDLDSPEDINRLKID